IGLVRRQPFRLDEVAAEIARQGVTAGQFAGELAEARRVEQGQLSDGVDEEGGRLGDQWRTRGGWAATGMERVVWNVARPAGRSKPRAPGGGETEARGTFFASHTRTRD